MKVHIKQEENDNNKHEIDRLAHNLSSDLTTLNYVEEVSDEIVLAHYPEYVEGNEQIITSLMDEGDKCFFKST